MRQRPGCLSGTGILAAFITAIIIAGYVYARGGLLFNPGPLNAQSGRVLGGVTSHAEIGGNCESCHTAPWESETMADRCLVCHTDIATELRSVESLHGEIIFNNPNLACRNCHPEHRGPTAPLLFIDDATFPHEAVGFSLNGHQRTSSGERFTCDNCHHGDITTFTTDTCFNCHRQMDVEFSLNHLLTFGAGCLGCHDGVDRYGDDFNHNQFVFQLTGRHAEVPCSGCHQNARTITDLQSTSQACLSCHGEPEFHVGMFGLDCAQCHTTDNWFARYNGPHPEISDEDEGGSGVNHGGASCRDCHTQTLHTATCLKCHEDNDP